MTVSTITMKFTQLGRTSLLAGITQGLGLLQLVLLFWGTEAHRASDAYFFIASWSQVPSQILLIGMMYPVWLRGIGIGRRSTTLWIASVPVAAVVTSVIAGFLFHRLTGGYGALELHVLLFSALGLTSAICWAYVLKLSSEGRPDWLAATTLLANIASCAVLSVGKFTSIDNRVTAMLIAQTLGMALYLGVLINWHPGLMRRMLVFDASKVSDQPRQSSGTTWYLSQSLTAYGGNLAIQTQTATMPASSLSVVGVISRVLAGLNSLVTNAIVPRLIHSNSSSANAIYLYLKAASIAVCIAATAVWAVDLARPMKFAPIALVILAWFQAAAMNASLKRVAVRYLHPRIALVSLVTSVAVPIGLTIFATTGSLSLGAVLGSLIAVDLVPGVVMAIVLDRWWLALSTILIVFSCLAVSLPALPN